MKDAEKQSIESFEAQVVQGHFCKETQLHTDIMNSWSRVQRVIDSQDMKLAEPIDSYEEYFKKKTDKNGNFGGIENFVEKILALTNKENMDEYNQLIEEFNIQLPKIIQDNNFDALKSFYKKATKLISNQDLKIYDQK